MSNLAAHIERGALPGLIALVARGNDVQVDVLGTKAFGDTEPMPRDAIFRIASLTKPITAAAAMILVAVRLAHPPAEQDRSPAPVAMSEVESKPAVDIVDALKLARRIRARQIDRSHDDFNHDGAVDQHDVDAIAMAAVRLPEGRMQ